MTTLIIDIETNGLKLDEIHTIHCMAIYDLSTNKSMLFTDIGPLYLQKEILEATTLIGHNILAYDIPILQKFFPFFKPKKVVDTLLLSRMLEPDRIEGHSLKSYSKEVGIEKIENEDWSVYTPLMGERCLNDVKLTAEIYNRFTQTISTWPHWDYSIQLEHDVAKIMNNQARSGWLFNVEKAKSLVKGLVSAIDAIDIELAPLLQRRCVQVGTTHEKPFNKSGGLCMRTAKLTLENISGSFSAIRFKGINLGSEKQMKELLTSLGWQPTTWNYKKNKRGKVEKLAGKPIRTSPKLTEDSYDSLPEGIGQTLASRLKCAHRLSLLRGLLENVRADGRIPAEVNSVRCNTARMTHRIVANIPKAIDGVFMGREMRSLFICSDGRVIVGVDAKALEARCLAHYVNDPDFTRDLLENDIHTVLQKIASLETRAQAKTLTYALMYGAGDNKLGSVVGGSAKEGIRLRKALYKKCPGLKRLMERVKEKATEQKYIKGIDGRKLFIRSSHSALNVLLQGCGAILMKVAIREMFLAVRKEHLDAFLVGTFHDEVQWDVLEKDASRVAVILENAIIKAGEILKLRCPMAGEAKIGRNWGETH